ncbi:SAF domain-containing protein [uncultured Pseudokineococcus sp.]|uniref:SAF domain-containing protein n=1 Tax=uncultured Pseudokineococcus sp. TaxID=1642928 RepID=UPI0026330B3F|nr:SAF domain-containing protein [uncultured Pseudokineococcus sp.]
MATPRSDRARALRAERRRPGAPSRWSRHRRGNPVGGSVREALAARLPQWSGRRLVAALLLAAAAGTAVQALQPAPAVEDGTVVVLTADAPAGHVLRATDVRAAPAPPGLVPRGAAASTAAAVGRRLASPAREGEVVTDARLAGPGLLAGARAGDVAVGLPLPAASSELVAPGDAVLVLAAPADPLLSDPSAATAPGAAVVAERAVVLRVPERGGDGALGPLGGADPAGGVVVLALGRDEARGVAAAVAARSGVQLALLPDR